MLIEDELAYASSISIDNIITAPHREFSLTFFEAGWARYGSKGFG